MEQCFPELLASPFKWNAKGIHLSLLFICIAPHRTVCTICYTNLMPQPCIDRDSIRLHEMSKHLFLLAIVLNHDGIPSSGFIKRLIQSYINTYHSYHSIAYCYWSLIARKNAKNIRIVFLTVHGTAFVTHLDFMSSAFVWVVLDTDRSIGVILDFRSQTIGIRSRHLVL